jgi:hypothetical protein
VETEDVGAPNGSRGVARSVGKKGLREATTMKAWSTRSSMSNSRITIERIER